MLQESNDRVASAISNHRYPVEAEEDRGVKPAVCVIDLFDASGQKASGSNASGREPVMLPDIVYLTRKRARPIQLINPVEDALYLLISAVALGFLVITFLGL